VVVVVVVVVVLVFRYRTAVLPTAVTMLFFF